MAGAGEMTLGHNGDHELAILERVHQLFAVVPDPCDGQPIMSATIGDQAMVASVSLTAVPVFHRPLGHIVGRHLIACQRGHGNRQGGGTAAGLPDGAGLAVHLISPAGIRLIIVDDRRFCVRKGDVAVVRVVVAVTIAVSVGQTLIFCQRGIKQRSPVPFLLGKVQLVHVLIGCQITDKDIQINIFEVKRPELDAVIVANNIARQVEGKIAYRRAIKMAIANTMRMGAEGIKVLISGRLNGAEMARSEMYKEGRTPLHTFRADIDYCHAEALTKVGLLGIKVWICRGEVYGKRELAPNFTQTKESGRGGNGNNNGGKNFKRKKNNR